jgi:uncharacterized protein
MTRITEFYNRDGYVIGFSVEGHANYSIPGRDIVCAAISALTINAINSIAELAGTNPSIIEIEGRIEYAVADISSVVTRTLLSAVRIGYRGLAEQYPDNVMMTGEKRIINVV